MTITLKNGNTYSVVPDDDSARYAELTGSDYIELKFSSAEYIEITPGSSVSFEGRTYWVERPQDVEIVHSRNYGYTVRLETEAARLRYLPFSNPDDNRVSFPVTGTLSDHLGLIVGSLTMQTGETWTAGNGLQTSEQKALTYDALSLREALEMLAEAYDTEFQIEGKTITVGKVEYNKSLPLNLKYGKNNGLLSGIHRSNYGDEPPMMGLYVKSGSRNLNTSSNQDAYGAKTLHMPEEVTHGVAMVIGFDGSKFCWRTGASSWTAQTGFNTSAARYYVVSGGGYKLLYAGTDRDNLTLPDISHGCSVGVAGLEDIYPTITHTVTAVAHTTPSGNDEAIYTITFNNSGNIDYADAQIPGNTIQIVFQSGMLTGKEFDVEFVSPASFRIQGRDIDDEWMPKGSYVPATGDTFKVFNCMLPQAYIRDDSTHTGAEWELAHAAVKYLDQRRGLTYSWSANLDPVYASSMVAANYTKLRIGGYVSFMDTSVQPEALLIRIIGLKQPLNHPKWMEITLAERSSLRRRRRAELLANSEYLTKLENINVTLNTDGQYIGDISNQAAGAVQNVIFDGQQYTPQNGTVTLPHVKTIDGITPLANQAGAMFTGRFMPVMESGENSVESETNARNFCVFDIDDGERGFTIDFRNCHDNHIIIDNSKKHRDLYWQQEASKATQVEVAKAIHLGVIVPPKPKQKRWERDVRSIQQHRKTNKRATAFTELFGVKLKEVDDPVLQQYQTEQSDKKTVRLAIRVR